MIQQTSNHKVKATQFYTGKKQAITITMIPEVNLSIAIKDNNKEVNNGLLQKDACLHQLM